jgi:hypothetical protein
MVKLIMAEEELGRRGHQNKPATREEQAKIAEYFKVVDKSTETGKGVRGSQDITHGSDKKDQKSSG